MKEINQLSLIGDIIKGLFLAILYFTITEADDTTPKNITVFSLCYIIMVNSARVVNIDPNLVTGAFITKTIFTLIDTRGKKLEIRTVNIDENKNKL
jgi:hypothetical protein